MSLSARRLSWKIGGCLVVDDVSLDVPAGSVLGLIGPNGSGKSSLLRLLAGLRAPSAGHVTLQGQDLAALKRRPLARRIALVEQHAATDLDLSVQAIVSLGRTPHRSALAPPDREDLRVIDQALAATGLEGLRLRRWHSLSGGERQRVQIARALAQQPSELLLDEPTNHLDIQHQLDILRLIRGLPLTCVMALHDLNLAAMFCDVLAVLDQGRLVASGTPRQVLTEALLQRVYGVAAEVSWSGEQGVHIRYKG
jgi:iron complex transport system ATP-binding protein